METNNIDQDIRDEITRRETVENELNLRLRQQETLAQIGEYAVRSKDLDDLFQEVTRLMPQVLEMEFCKVLELLEDEKALLLRAGVGWKKGLVGRARVGTGVDSHSGYTLLFEEPVILTDLRTETRFSGSKLLKDHKIVSGMSAIIPGKDQPFGVLSVYTTRSRVYHPHDTRFLKGISGILGSAIERFRTEEELRHSRDELAIILDGVSEGITVQDKTGRLVFANRAGAALIGFDSVDDAIHSTVQQVLQNFEILDEEGNPFPVESLPGRQVLKGAPRASARIHFRVKRTGEERWSITDATPVYDPQGNVIQTVNIFRDITDIVRFEKRQKLLSEAGGLLASSLDYETTLSNFTRLVVNNLADWCIVRVVTAENGTDRTTVGHRDPQKIALAEELEQRFPPEPGIENAMARVIRTGKPEFYPEVTEDLLRAAVRDPQHLEMIRSLQIRSAITLPLNARGRTIGAITLIWAESGRAYTQSEMYLAQDLADRAALAIENARLYQQAQNINTELEQRVEKRTRQLELSRNHLVKEIDERKKAESALRKSEALLNSLFESAPDAVLLIDPTGMIVRMNQQAEAAFQYSREELLGKNIDTLLPESFQHRHAIERSRFFEQMSTRPMGAGMELKAMRKDRTQFPVDIMLSPVKTEEGNLVIGAVRDMTEQKRMQTELEETHRRLFESVEAERLLLSQELHDGPIQELYGIALAIESLKDGVDGGHELEELVSATGMVQSIIQTLRTICGELRPPVLTQFGLEKAIRSHLMKLQDSHPELMVKADLMSDNRRLSERVRLALFRVYQNAVSNIVRHAAAKNIYVSFSIHAERAALLVRDDGRGFVVPKRRVELVRSGHFGLAGIAERIEALNGTVSIESNPGQGTKIQVEIPIEEE